MNLAECARQLRGEGKGIGKRHLGEMAAIAPVALERREVGAVVAPETGGPTVTRQEYGQPRAPGPGTQNQDRYTFASASPSPAGRGRG